MSLTPTSTPKEIYAQIDSLTKLRRQANLFEAALSEQQRPADIAEKGDDSVEYHSTCFKLYQAVRSLRKRDNKKETKDQLYPTLVAAFDAHRRRTLTQDCDDEKSSYFRSAEESISRRTTLDPSHPPSSSVSAIAIPTSAVAAAAGHCLKRHRKSMWRPTARVRPALAMAVMHPAPVPITRPVPPAHQSSGQRRMRSAVYCTSWRRAPTGFMHSWE